MQPAPHSCRSFLAAATTAAAGLTLKPAFGDPQDLVTLTLKKASELLRSKVASPVELTQACLKRIERYNSTLNAFISVMREEVLKAAREMDGGQRRGKCRSPLHCVPIALI